MRCDRVALIQKGQILTIDEPEKIREGFSHKLFRVKATDKYHLLIALRNYPGVLTAYPFGDSVHVTFRNDDSDPSVSEYLTGMGIGDATICETKAGIEDRFLELMGG